MSVWAAASPDWQSVILFIVLAAALVICELSHRDPRG